MNYETVACFKYDKEYRKIQQNTDTVCTNRLIVSYLI